MHFGENQLSPNSISFSLLSTPHPRLFQQASVRSSTTLHRSFNLDMDRSSGFGSIIRNLTALFRLGFPSAPVLPHLNLATHNNSPAHFTKGIPSHTNKSENLPHAPIACKHTDSGLFTPLPGCFSPFPHGTLLYRSSNIFSLGPWSAQIQTEFHVLRPTQVSYLDSPMPFAYGALTLYGRLSQYRSTKHGFCNCPSDPQLTPVQPFNPSIRNAHGLARIRFRL